MVRLLGKGYGSESIFEIGIDTQSDLQQTSLGYYYMRAAQKKNAMGWFLASDYFLNRLAQDDTDVRWGVMDNDESWSDTKVERKGPAISTWAVSTCEAMARSRQRRSISR